MLPTPCGTFGTRTNRLGRTYLARSFQFDPAVCGVCPLRSQCVAARYGAGRTVALHPQEALLQQARDFQRSEGFAEYRRLRPGGRASPGAAGATGGPPISLLRPSQDPIPTTHGGHGGQPDPGGYQDGDGYLRLQAPLTINRTSKPQGRPSLLPNSYWPQPTGSLLASDLQSTGYPPRHPVTAGLFSRVSRATGQHSGSN